MVVMGAALETRRSEGNLALPDAVFAQWALSFYLGFVLIWGGWSASLTPSCQVHISVAPRVPLFSLGGPWGLTENLKGMHSDICKSSVCSAAQACPILCDPMDCRPPGSSVHGILPARILEWAAVPSPWNLPCPGIEPVSLVSRALAGRFFTTRATREALMCCIPSF